LCQNLRYVKCVFRQILGVDITVKVTDAYGYKCRKTTIVRTFNF